MQKHLGGIFVVKRGRPVQITFHNNLPNKHLMPVDTSIMGAGQDQDQNRTAVHVHGGLTSWFSDGTPFTDWSPQGFKAISCIGNQVLRPHDAVPDADMEYFYTNDQSARMIWYHDHALGITRLNAYAGLASGYIIRDDFESKIMVPLLGLPKFIENGGRELPLVFQDKIFQNPVGDLDPGWPGSHAGAGELWYPYTYDPNRWALGPGLPPPAVSNIPEMFGDTMLVNGTAYPKVAVDPRHYRLRMLNACQARFLNLQLYEDDGHGNPVFTKPGPNWNVIGTEGGFLARPVSVPSGQPILSVTDPLAGTRSVDPAHPGGSLITAPAERWDIVVDFTGKGGKKYILWNDAPGPYPGGDLLNDYPHPDGVGDTQRLMRFEVKADSSSIPKDPLFLLGSYMPLAGDPLSRIDPPLAGSNPSLPAMFQTWLTASTAPLPIPTRPDIVKVRQLTLNEITDEFGRLIQMLGTNLATTDGDFSRPYGFISMNPYSASTENVKAGTTEVWQIANTTGDTHPIHLHLVNFQILSRQPFDVNAYQATAKDKTATPTYTGPARGPDATELGWKETVKMNPGEVTTIIMKFNVPKVPFTVPPSPRTGGMEYVWHCHILEHEEHDMMRPLIVNP